MILYYFVLVTLFLLTIKITFCNFSLWKNALKTNNKVIIHKMDWP